MDTVLNNSKVSLVPDLCLILRAPENQWFTGFLVSKSVYSIDQHYLDSTSGIGDGLRTRSTSWSPWAAHPAEVRPRI